MIAEGAIYLANVGANASHGFAGPIFGDRTFEFLPIPENPDIGGVHAVRYCDLRSYSDPHSDLLKYVPKRLWSRATHNDPEFDTFTYGDNCSTSPRGAALKQVKPSDTLIFLSRLAGGDGNGPTGSFGFYLVGFLHVEEVIREVTGRPCGPVLDRFAANAHVRRGLSDPKLWDGFWAFGGSEHSRRFPKAVPVTRNLCAEVFLNANGSPWSWDSNRTDLQVIGSYTRSCRCFINPILRDGRKRAEVLWAWIERYST